MKAVQGWGRARVYTNARLLKSPSNEPFVSVMLEFEQRPRGFSQRIELRSWQPEDIARHRDLIQGVMVKFKGEVDAAVMIGADSKVYANPRITGRIVKIYDGGEA